LSRILPIFARLSLRVPKFGRRDLSLIAMGAVVASMSSVPVLAGTREPSVVAVHVAGNAHVPTDEILSQIQTRAGSRFDPALLQQDLRRIFALGYFTDQIPPTITHRPGGVEITFNVVENPIIKHIEFEGDHVVPPETLLALMDSAPGQVLNTNTFHEDVLKINNYYDKLGYGGQVPTHVQDLNIDPASGTLRLKVLEGLTIRHVIIAGPPTADPVLPAAEIQRIISLHPGDVYSDTASQKDGESLAALYQHHDLQLGDYHITVAAGSIDPRTETADVVYQISAARVAAVEITGNSKTKDAVIRRQLRLHAGDLVTQSGLRRDYERINNLGFFDKVDLVPKPGPDPAIASEVTLDWSVKEARTGTATIGAGYSGGLTGQGLTGNVGYSESNVNGTGNSSSVRFQRGSLVSDVELSASVPYLGDSPKAQKYSLSGSVYFDNQTNYYPVYGYSPAGSSSGTAVPQSPTAISGAQNSVGTTTPTGQGVAVQLLPNGAALGGVVSNYNSRNNGVSLTLGRRLSDNVTASIGTTVSRIATDVSVPAGYYFGDSSVTAGASGAQALGIVAPSIADQNGTGGYNLRSLTFGLATDTRDDYFNPRRGYRAQLSEEVSQPGLGSDFKYGITTIDAAKFLPFMKSSTLGLHTLIGKTQGAIPASNYADTTMCSMAPT
jgi:outer membrane protein assembly factor BamA